MMKRRLVGRPARSGGHTALVLAGGAALGAYEVGVVRYLQEQIAPELGDGSGGLHCGIICGTSAGALNAAVLAARADQPRTSARQLAEMWTALELNQVLRPSGLELLGLLLDSRIKRLPGPFRGLRGGVLDPRPLAAMLRRLGRLDAIDEHVATGRVHAVALSATQVSTGRCISFVHTRAPLTDWPVEPLARPQPARLREEHALASAAIPLLFPAVVIDGDAYCDGGLRQVVPLSSALHLGAEAIVAINPVAPEPEPEPGVSAARLGLVTSPVYLAGKALNALFIDRMEVDLARVEQVNAIIDAGRRRYGPGFVREINRELVAAGEREVRSVRVLRLQPSRDLGNLAAAYLASREFRRRESGLAGILLRLIGRGDPERGGDLLSYLLFDGAFAAQLIELGWADASARHEQLRAFFAAGAARRLEVSPSSA